MSDPRFDTPVAHLYPYVSKDWPPPAKLSGAVEVRVRIRGEEVGWKPATLLQAMSGPRGCFAVLNGERVQVQGDKKGTPIGRYFDWTAVRPR